MKNHVVPPFFTTAVAVECGRFQVSSVQCTVLALHDLPVSAEVPAPVLRCTLSFSAVTAVQASATAELSTPTIASTPPRSYHSRTTPTATSGLF